MNINCKYTINSNKNFPFFLNLTCSKISLTNLTKRILKIWNLLIFIILSIFR